MVGTHCLTLRTYCSTDDLSHLRSRTLSQKDFSIDHAVIHWLLQQTLSSGIDDVFYLEDLLFGFVSRANTFGLLSRLLSLIKKSL